MSMRVSLSGSSRNVRRAMRAMYEELKVRMTPEDFEEFEHRHQPKAEMYMLEMLQKHASATSAGEHTVEDFAVFYCLKEPEGGAA